jgi:hypothetical protein
MLDLIIGVDDQSANAVTHDRCARFLQDRGPCTGLGIRAIRLASLKSEVGAGQAFETIYGNEL